MIGTRALEIDTGQAGVVNERALADLRDRAHADLLADPVFQGMDDHDRQFIYDVFGVWTVQSAADYHEFTTRLAELGNQVPTTRQALDHLRDTCASTLQGSLGVTPEHVHVTPAGLSLDG